MRFACLVITDDIYVLSLDGPQNMTSTNALRVKFVAVLGSQTELGNGCIIGAMCNVSSHETLADNTVVYHKGVHRRRSWGSSSQDPPNHATRGSAYGRTNPNFGQKIMTFLSENTVSSKVFFSVRQAEKVWCIFKSSTVFIMFDNS
jgi:hypothetical protein